MRKKYVKPLADVYYAKSEDRIANGENTLKMPDESQWTEYF